MSAFHSSDEAREAIEVSKRCKRTQKAAVAENERDEATGRAMERMATAGRVWRRRTRATADIADCGDLARVSYDSEEAIGLIRETHKEGRRFVGEKKGGEERSRKSRLSKKRKMEKVAGCVPGTFRF